MKKAEQEAMNAYAIEQWVSLESDYANAVGAGRLASCQAWLYTASGVTFLMSYSTVVACHNHITGEFFDMLRFAYGYTATSAQHIAKFKRLMNPAKVFTYRPV